MFLIAIVEDEQIYADLLKSYLSRYAKETGTRLKTVVFSNGLDFLEQASRGFDLVIMDISLPAMNGMDVARQFRELDSVAVLIFVTQITQYAVNGYQVDAMDYMVKPVPYPLFSMRMDKACRLMAGRDIGYLLSSTEGAVRLQISDIYYVESQGHYMVFTTARGTFRSRITMKSLEQQLQKHHFSRPNHSFLLNLRYVSVISAGSVELSGRSFPITRSHRQKFLDALTLYLGGRILHD